MQGARQLGSAAVLVLLGLVGLVVTGEAHDPAAGLLTTILGTVFPAFLSVGLVGAGLWLAVAEDIEGRGAARVLEWSVAGMVGLGALGGAALVFQRRGYVLDEPVFVIVSTVVSGAVAGFGVGFYDVWSRRQQDELEREREKLDHLNRLLRHHLLNGMNVMLAKLDMAARNNDDPAVDDDLGAARQRGEEIVTLVEQVSAIAGRPGAEPTDVDIARLLQGEAERIRAIHGEDAVTVAEPLPAVTVRSTASLSEAVGVLLDDTVKTGGGRATVSAAVDGDTAVVSVSATGTPTPDGGDRHLGGPGSRVGLSVADVLVERAGGELVTPSTADNTVQLRFPLA